MESFEENSPKKIFFNWCVMGLFWTLIFSQMSFEWQNNPQYEYGMFVPFLGAYLFYLRWLDRPHSEPMCFGTVWPLWILSACVALYYPAKIIFEMNADWRLAGWSVGLLAFIYSVTVFTAWGGKPWALHFYRPFFFFLLGISWPRSIELWLIDNMLYLVSNTTVEILNFFGVLAVQNGNLIKLMSGYLSMEEACSGVRSFQSSVMIAFFLGDLLRFRMLQTIGLAIIGAIAAVFFNLMRTTILCFMVNKYGSEVMTNWHDIAGHTVFVFCGLVLILFAYIIKKYNNYRYGKPAIPLERYRQPYYLSIKPNICFTFLLILTIPTLFCWYHWDNPLPNEGLGWKIDWEQIQPDIELEAFPDYVQEILLYDVGEQAKWRSEEGYSWLAYYFLWERPKAAQLGGFHTPEHCLQTAGWGKPIPGKFITWKKNDVELIFKTFQFGSGKDAMFVFFAQWDLSNYPYHEKDGRSRMERLRQVWLRERCEDKTSLEIALQGPSSFDEAYASFEKFLDQAILVTDFRNKPRPMKRIKIPKKFE